MDTFRACGFLVIDIGNPGIHDWHADHLVNPNFFDPTQNKTLTNLRKLAQIGVHRYLSDTYIVTPARILTDVSYCVRDKDILTGCEPNDLYGIIPLCKTSFTVYGYSQYTKRDVSNNTVSGYFYFTPAANYKKEKANWREMCVTVKETDMLVVSGKTFFKFKREKKLAFIVVRIL